MTIAPSPVTSDRLLLTVREVAALLGVSPRQIWKLNSTGRIPAPLRLSRSVRWSAETISAWVRLGCPSRDRFEAVSGRGGATG